jgi:hypothetical protein
MIWKQRAREAAAYVACAPLTLWLVGLLALVYVGQYARLRLLRWLLPPLEVQKCEVVVIHPPQLPGPTF